MISFKSLQYFWIYIFRWICHLHKGPQIVGPIIDQEDFLFYCSVIFTMSRYFSTPRHVDFVTDQYGRSWSQHFVFLEVLQNYFGRFKTVSIDHREDHQERICEFGQTVFFDLNGQENLFKLTTLTRPMNTIYNFFCSLIRDLNNFPFRSLDFWPNHLVYRL